MKRQQLLLPLLLLSSIAYAVFTYWPLIGSMFPTRKPAAVKTAPVVLVTPAPTMTAETAVVSAEAGTLEATRVPTREEIIDPFVLRLKVNPKTEPKVETQQAGTAEVKVAQPELQGIWVDASMKIAFISDQTVVEGGQIMGWRVARIEKAYVMLNKGGKQRILKLEGLQ